MLLQTCRLVQVLSIAIKTVLSFATRHGQDAEGSHMLKLRYLGDWSVLKLFDDRKKDNGRYKTTPFLPLTDTALICYCNNYETHMN